MLLRLGSFLWLLIICVLLFLPDDNLPSQELIPHQDKIAHFVLFSVFSVLWLTAFRRNSLVKEKLTIVIILLFGLILAGLSELIQEKIPGRSADPVDFLIDLIGLSAGMFFHFLIEKRNHSVMK